MPRMDSTERESESVCVYHCHGAFMVCFGFLGNASSCSLVWFAGAYLSDLLVKQQPCIRPYCLPCFSVKCCESLTYA
ncbi:hypothetical protein OUZ56_022665 [Daphnia magna]|uniref:Uncharacterized protein n=1 Tax=Daphnia magna TaxID=35525 RepID=A0ABR0AX42_9CRUS|nr:hypothetical protein OUZ56_022665 [Daphnia magna]